MSATCSGRWLCCSCCLMHSRRLGPGSSCGGLQLLLRSSKWQLGSRHCKPAQQLQQQAPKNIQRLQLAQQAAQLAKMQQCLRLKRQLQMGTTQQGCLVVASLAAAAAAAVTVLKMMQRARAPRLRGNCSSSCLMVLLLQLSTSMLMRLECGSGSSCSLLP